MCGRFNVIDSPGLQQLLRDLGINLQLPPAVNVAPTEQVLLVRNSAPDHDRTGQAEAAGAAGDSRQADYARWWLTPAWAPRVEQKYAMFNARSETLASSRAFRRPFARQRGIVPMSSFIEWRPEEGVKQPWLISNEAGALAVAALWDVWTGPDGPLLSCSLVTTAAAAEFEPWHKRMPVLLTDAERDRWLDNEHPIASDDPLFRNELKYPLRLVPLTRAVGNSGNKDARLLEPLAEPVELCATAIATGSTTA